MIHGIVLDDKNRPVITELMIVSPRDRVKVEAPLTEAIIKLNQIYQQVPKPNCNRCGGCCDGTKAGNPVVYSIEYLNIISQLNSPANRELKGRIYGSALMGRALLDRKKKEIATEPGLKRCDSFLCFCPALDLKTKLCLVYEYRPLICRLYGVEGWSKGPDGWIKPAERVVCEHVEISKDDKTEHWVGGQGRLLFDQLKRLSTYYYFDEAAEELFNKNSITHWFALKQRK
jgi:Fe-S-cluster containining protein